MKPDDLNREEDTAGPAALNSGGAGPGFAPVIGSVDFVCEAASDPLSRQGILNAKTDRDKVNAAWARVLALGERLESVALAQHELLNAVKEAVEIEKATGEHW